MKPVEIEYLIKNGTRATLEQISADFMKTGSDGSQSGDAISAAFVRTQSEIALTRDAISSLEARLLELQSVNPDLDQSANIAEADQLKTKIGELKSHLVQLEQTAENTQVLPSSLPAAKQQFNGLHMSIQQMAREMPSLAMGPQMFFLAISNNLPIFTDELARARMEYDALKKSGQTGTPVWQQIAGSLISWQTALTTGIMLLVMYGDEIVKSISDMTGWGAAEQARRAEIEKSIEVEKEAIKSTTEARLGLEQSIKSIEEFNGSKDEERQKIDELNDKYGDAFGCYQTLDGWYDTLTTKAEAYTNMLILQAKNQSLVNDYIAAEQKVAEINASDDDDLDGGLSGLRKYGMTDFQIAAYNKKNRAEVLSEAQAELADIKARMVANNAEIETIASDNNLNEVVSGSVADLENSIAQKRKALKGLTDPAEYERQLSEIEALEARIRAITGEADPDAVNAANTETQYQNARLSSLREAAEAELEIERSKITDKIKLIEFNRDAQIAAITAEKQAYRDKYGADADVSGFDRQITATSDQADADMADVRAAAQEEQQKSLESTLATIESYERQRASIVEEYAARRKVLYKDEAQTILNEGVTQSDVDWLNNAESTDLTSLDLSAAQASSKIKAIWDDTSNVASEALDKIIVDAESLYGVLTTQGVEYSADIGQQFGLTKEQFEALLNKIPELRERIEQLREQSDAVNVSFAGLSGAWKQMVKGAKDGDLDVFQQGLDGLNNKVGPAIDLANGLADALANIGEASGNEAWSNTAEGIGQVTSVLSDTLGMAQAGAALGPIGAAVGAVVGLGSAIAGMCAEAAATKRETERLNDELTLNSYNAQYEVNQLYRERYDWARKIAETELESAQRNIIETRSQLDANGKEQADLLAKLHEQEYTSGYHFEKTGIFGLGKGKSVDDRSSLAGKSYDEILELEAAGALTPEAQGYLDQLKSLYDEEGELAQRLEDARVAQQEAWAGMSMDDAVDAAMDDLLDGNITAAEAYDRIMQGAAKNMLKELMSDDTQEWYKGFAAAGEGGYTDEEREYWKRRWEKLQLDNAQRKEDIERTTGVDLDVATSQSGRSGSFEALNQDQGTKLEGLFTASEMRVARVEEQVESVAAQMATAVGHLAAIETNTGTSARSLKDLVEKIDQIIRDGLKMK